MAMGIFFPLEEMVVHCQSSPNQVNAAPFPCSGGVLQSQKTRLAIAASPIETAVEGLTAAGSCSGRHRAQEVWAWKRRDSPTAVSSFGDLTVSFQHQTGAQSPPRCLALCLVFPTPNSMSVGAGSLHCRPSQEGVQQVQLLKMLGWLM